MVEEEGGSEGMNGLECFPLKRESGEEHRKVYFCLRSLPIFVTHNIDFIPLVAPAWSCKNNFLAPLEPNYAFYTAKMV